MTKAPSPTARLFRILVLALAATIVVFVGVGYLLTDRWQVDTDRLISAAPARVQTLVSDFNTWPDWSGMKVELGAGMERRISGDAGQVGHQIEWIGAQGTATLRLSAVAGEQVDYEFLTRRAEDPQAAVVAHGHIAWTAEGESATRVRWHDEGKLQNLIERWIGWFGALQEQVRQIQGVSLTGLQRAVETG
ncbi:MAG: SRPBCC family protein [bacterium]|nr:SRPBCC family protein [bacterium]